MGSQQDIMNDYALQELRHIYSSYDGWKMTPRKQGNGYDMLVRLERLHGGHRDIVKVLVTFSKEIPAGSVAELNKKESAGDGMVPRFDTAVIAPINADTSGLPAGMKFYSMNAFEFQGDELVWLKKKVAKAEEPAKKAA